MDAVAHIKAGYRNYARFSGRTSRPEYWVFAGFLLVGQILSFVIAPLVAGAFLLLSGMPGFAAAARRLHDAGRSAWWLVLPLLVTPAWLLIWIASAASAMAVRDDLLDDSIYFMSASVVMLAVVCVMLIWLTAPSQPGPNRYGPNPNEVTS